MAGFAVDLASGMAVDGVIAEEDHGMVVRHQGQDEPAELASQSESRPRRRGEDPLRGGAVSVSQWCGGAKQVGDGASPGTEDGRSEQGDESGEGRCGEDRRKSFEQREGFRG
jgi:hypothetical protein